MSAYNTFLVTLDGPDGAQRTCEFQAYVGVLELREIRVGEPIANAPPGELRGTVAPSLEAVVSGRPFWAYGVGVCGDDAGERYARLRFRDGRFTGAELVDEPEDYYEWGFEDE